MTLPRVASYRRQPWAIKSTTPMVLVHVHRFPNKQTKPPARNPPQTKSPIPRAIPPNETNHPTRNLPKRSRRGGACVPARTSAPRRFHPKIHALCTGNERWMRPYGATRAGTQAPPLPISIIFFCTIPHKQNNHLRAIRPYQTPPNRTVYHNRIAVILSIAQGWQVQRSLPWVMVRGRMLPPWGLYSFSSHIITTRGEWIIRE